MIEKKHFISLHRPTLYFITGLPGTGKSTYAEKIKKEKNIQTHVEADHWMVDEKNNYFFNPSKLFFCHKQCIEKTELFMKQNKSVIVSNTSLTKKEAIPYFNLAKKFQYNIELTHLETQYRSIHNVPIEKIKFMKLKRQIYNID